jgi:hypothetical protein
MTFKVMEGGAKGADAAARAWACRPFSPGVLIEHFPFPADWDKYGKAAGPIRNQQMLDEGHPDMVIAFHDDLTNSKGTKDMVKRAKKAGVPVYLVSRL